MQALYPLTMSQLLADGNGESLYRWVITTIPNTTSNTYEMIAEGVEKVALYF